MTFVIVVEAYNGFNSNMDLLGTAYFFNIFFKVFVIALLLENISYNCFIESSLTKEFI